MAGKKPDTIAEGTLRIRAKDFKVCERAKTSWKLSLREFPEAIHAVQLFRAHGNLDYLIDRKDTGFLKGQLSPDGKTQGARINILPDGRKLDKAYSIFAEDLVIHDEASNSHWDILYKNPGGTYSYVYTLEKKEKSVRKKYKEVEAFEKYYPLLNGRVLSALKDETDMIAVPLYTLLKTYMRVGNEIYYKAHGHKGLTTLKKEDISIDGNRVTFSYLAKDGVPRKIIETFPDVYIARLKKILRPLRNSSFVFVNAVTGHPLTDVHFKEAFLKYCGSGFYPHIVRSFYATEKAKEFLKKHSSATKDELRAFFLSIADKLGHKRFVKKEKVWKDNYTVTVNHYIQPEIVDKIRSLVK
ncbi:MAG: hypothetical protein U9O53_03495 [archaeon]|nr:hypothetical protein [archaeon]